MKFKSVFAGSLLLVVICVLSWSGPSWGAVPPLAEVIGAKLFLDCLGSSPDLQDHAVNVLFLTTDETELTAAVRAGLGFQLRGENQLILQMEGSPGLVIGSLQMDQTPDCSSGGGGEWEDVALSSLLSMTVSKSDETYTLDIRDPTGHKHYQLSWKPVGSL